jgi:ribonuclease III
VDEENGQSIKPTESFTELEALLGYHFQDRSILQRALIHRSFVNEHEGEGWMHNESMEFLGDSVLGFLISSRIYQKFPLLTEGELSKIKAYLASAANLVRLAEKIKVGEHIWLSKGEEKTGGRKKRAILVDAFEAIVGAIYLDGGVDAASSFVDRQLSEFLEELNVEELTYGDFKSALQEFLHDHGQSEPVYEVIQEIGPDHGKTFVVQVSINGQAVSEASGKTKKEAQQEAARFALEKFRKMPPRNGSSPLSC